MIDPPPPPPPPPTGTVVGIVRNAANTAIAGAEVSIGALHTSTGVDGTFALNNVPGGSATIRCTSPGLADYTSNITVAAGTTTTHHIRLVVQEVFEVMNGVFSLFVPASVTVVRGIIFALGGPDTRPFANPSRSFNVAANAPADLESELLAMGTDYRLLAAREKLAVLGYGNVSQSGLEISIWVALEEVAAMASRPALATAPLLIHGIGGGAPAAAQLTARNASRVAGLVLRVPGSISDRLSPESGSVPTYVITAELDVEVDNNVTMAMFQQVRTTGGLWAFAKEPQVPHQSLSSNQRQLLIEWFTTILSLREPTTPGGPLRAIAEESGWLGAPGTRVVSSWADYVGDKRAASWFPTQATAERWRGFTGTQ